jgi:hypothetical protein
VSEAEQVAAIVRAGLWAFFAAVSLHSGAEPRPNDTHTTTAERAKQDADYLLGVFCEEFPLEEMLA